MTFLYYYLAAKTLLKAVMGVFSFASNTSGLPDVIYLVSLALLVLGIWTLARHWIGKGKPNDLARFYILDAVATAFNLVVASGASMLTFGVMDLAVTGSLLDLLMVVVALLVLRWRKTATLSSGKQSFTDNTEDPVSEVN